MRRLERSVSVLCRLRMTGIESLNLSAICWASLKDLGITRCTRTSPLPRVETGLSTVAERPGGAGQRWHRHEPRHRHGRALDEGVELPRRDPRLAGLFRHVDLEQYLKARTRLLAMAAKLAQRRLGRHGVDEAHVGNDEAHPP